MEKEVEIYRTKEGKEPLIAWLEGLRDKVLKHRIHARIKEL